MKLFRLKSPLFSFYKMRFAAFLLLSGLLLGSCATFQSQKGKEVREITDNFSDASQNSHRYILIGDAGNWEESESASTFELLEKYLVKSDTATTLLFMGDNVYPYGIPAENAEDYNRAVSKLNRQIEVAKKNKGKSIFIPGNHDWYSGIEGLKRQRDLVENALGKKSFLPRKGCGMAHLDINESTALIVIDSEWMLQDWDNHPIINEDCDIKTRDMFYAELEDKIKDYQNKTLLIAVHHPVFSNGPHGGIYSFKNHIFPFNNNVALPVLGSVINVLRRTSGLSPADMQNKKYNAFIKRLKVLIQGRENVVVISGHDHNLQYIEQDGIRQVISGSGSKIEAAKAVGPRDFSVGELGFGIIDVRNDGAAKLQFISVKTPEQPIFETQLIQAKKTPKIKVYSDSFTATRDTSVYAAADTKKSKVYRFFWGDHYRYIYSQNVNVPQVKLDTLFGGVTPIKEGGGNQSRSVRLQDPDGREYVMRALKKSATRFLQTAAFKDQWVQDDFRNTYTEKFLMDYYTTSHPYTNFAIPYLSEPIKLHHSNPKLVYIPKQNALGIYNEDHGNELYMLEERPMDKFLDLPSFGKPEDFINTNDLLANIQSDPKYYVDEKLYIRARMFDMLIGDWDRHSDQWRWAEFTEKNKVKYEPIARDRDQAFTKIDGTLLSLLMKIPALRHMKSYKDRINNIKWFNKQAYHLDLTLIPDATEADWVKQAKYIQEHLSDADIDKAFAHLPKEVQDHSIEEIKQKMRIRLKDLQKYAAEYHKVLMRIVMVVGSDRDDRFEIVRDGKNTKVVTYRTNKHGEEKQIRKQNFDDKLTKEIWIYGLTGADRFEVSGKANRTRIRLLGGTDEDIYVADNGKKVSIYDFKSKPNNYTDSGSATKTLSNDYALNSYDYKRPKFNVFAGYPLMWFNPDDGIKIGAVLNYTVNNFHRNPFSQKHIVGGNYYFATNGYELNYKGVFPRAIGQWNFQFLARYTSANFSQNFFGFGNETPNYDEELNMNYNRVKVSSFWVAPAVEWKGTQGASAYIQAQLERVRVDKNEQRFIGQSNQVNPDVFSYKNFADFNAEYRFENYDESGFPTLGMLFYAKGGYKLNIDYVDDSFPYAESAFGLTYKLIPSGDVVLASMVKGKMLFEDSYEFYQAATVGGDADLRGYRNQRFSGRSSFYHTTDVRWNIAKLKTPVLPLTIGVLAGYDYGRVWYSGEESTKWHHSAGMGLWVSGLNIVTGRVSYFRSGDGGRLFVGVGFGF